MTVSERKGKLIVLDGADGSGKATQVALLEKRLRTEGHKVKTISFPRYHDNMLGGLIGECLRGECGDFVALHPKIASVLYAADRFESRKILENWLKNGYTVIADRYVSANQIHQGGKIADAKKRASFLQWLDTLEFEVFGLPRPDMVIYLEVPTALAEKLLRESKKPLDEAEKNEAYQKNALLSARWLSTQYAHWQRVVCAKRGVLLTREDIHEEIYQLLTKRKLI